MRRLFIGSISLIILAGFAIAAPSHEAERVRPFAGGEVETLEGWLQSGDVAYAVAWSVSGELLTALADASPRSEWQPTGIRRAEVAGSVYVAGWATASRIWIWQDAISGDMMIALLGCGCPPRAVAVGPLVDVIDTASGPWIATFDTTGALSWSEVRISDQGDQPGVIVVPGGTDPIARSFALPEPVPMQAAPCSSSWVSLLTNGDNVEQVPRIWRLVGVTRTFPQPLPMPVVSTSSCRGEGRQSSGSRDGRLLAGWLNAQDETLSLVEIGSSVGPVHQLEAPGAVGVPITLAAGERTWVVAWQATDGGPRVMATTVIDGVPQTASEVAFGTLVDSFLVDGELVVLAVDAVRGEMTVSLVPIRPEPVPTQVVVIRLDTQADLDGARSSTCIATEDRSARIAVAVGDREAAVVDAVEGNLQGPTWHRVPNGSCSAVLRAILKDR